ncbi:hypothetical protein LDJ79_00940 [Vibrio tritonius]|uniref:Type II secretion system protein GspF domain-containing protein n=1 Tax=Vibrio tritonius TaxID=1435069 RepID=A0ABS7YG69_9VIBR|nr:hypothetical protein [Vibrio tritonius]MCA2014655.1 hypothetical protein [Vibrio tritonius]
MKLIAHFTSFNEKKAVLADIHSMLSTGVPLLDIANDLQKFGSSFQKKLGEKLLDRIQNKTGNAFSIADIFDDYYHPFVGQAIRMGERDNRIADGFKNATNSLQLSSGLMSKLTPVVSKPLLQFLLLVGGIAYLNDMVFGVFVDLLPLKKWPPISLFYYNAAINIQQYWLIYCLLILAGIVLLLVSMGNLTGSIRHNVDDWFPYRQYRMQQSANVLFGLGTLIASGTPPIEAIEQLKKQSSKYTAYHLNMMTKSIEQATGDINFGRHLDTGLLDKRQIERLKLILGHSVTNLSDNLLKISNFHKAALNSQIDKISTFSDIFGKIVNGCIALGYFLATIMIGLNFSG